jgi:dethiobiotin synthetase
MRKLFVSAIGTDVGKTVASAVLARAWGMGYWKPVQAGELAYSDSDKLREWAGDEVRVFPEAFRLQEAMSPHAAAEREGIRIGLDDFELPDTEGDLLIEGAGGLLVPLNYQGDSMLDLAERFDAEILLISWNFLGSINQTLLSCEVLSHRNVPVRGILFCGPENEESERVIERNVPFPVLGRIPEATPGASWIEARAKSFESVPPFRYAR